MGIHYKITFSTCPDMMQLTTFQTTVSRRMIFTVLLAVDPANPPPHRTLQTHSQCQARQGVMVEMVMVIVSRRISIAFISLDQEPLEVSRRPRTLQQLTVCEKAKLSYADHCKQVLIPSFW